MKTLAQIAYQFQGIKEIGDNKGFDNLEFAELMHAAGFKKGDPWCMTFVKVCVELYLSQISSGYIRILRKNNIFNAGSQLTFKNIKKHYPKAIVEKPTDNNIVIWQKFKQGKGTDYGHGAILHFFNNPFSQAYTIDGNTNEAGSSEGDSVMEKNRVLKKDTRTGWRFKGFVSIDILIKLMEDEIKEQNNRL